MGGEGGDGCVHDAPLATAIEVCMMEGARLCTVEEIQGACTAGTGCGHDADMIWTSAQCSNDGDLPSIVDIAISDDSFSTLVAAVVAADLVDVLAGDGTFTVFAPTNDAFENLPDGTLDTLLQPENVQQLTDILLYHVLGSIVTSSDLSDGLTATTLQGSTVTVMVTGGVRINDANVIVADVEASNGIVHVIDAVLLPPTSGEEGAPDNGRPTTHDEEETDTVVAGSNVSSADIIGVPITVFVACAGSLVLLISVCTFCYCRKARLRALGKADSYGHQAVPMEDDFSNETDNLWG